MEEQSKRRQKIFSGNSWPVRIHRIGRRWWQVRRGIGLLALFALMVVLMAQTLSWYAQQGTPVVEPVIIGRAETLVLDAGHGGEDGGAVSLSGVPESQINLAIVLKMDDLFGLYGVAPVLLREEDISLHDDSAVTLREKKVSDLKNRVKAIESVDRAVLLSIHQNTFSDQRYHGAQAFYAPTEGSQQLAASIQNAIRMTLQPDNSRQEKKIPDSVYLMNHITCPAVLVECGFLTNPGEEEQLLDSSYQKKMAAVLVAAWLNYGA